MKRSFWLCKRLDDPGTFEEKVEHTNERVETSERKANLVGSRVQGATPGAELDWHMPVLDIDIPAQLIPSTTEGHHHLYLDVVIPWDKYERLLLSLEECGIIEEGYSDASRRRKQTFVRKPGVRKGRDAPDSNFDGKSKRKRRRKNAPAPAGAPTARSYT